MLYQKLEEYYKSFTDFLTLKDYLELLNLLSFEKHHFSKEFIIKKLAIYVNDYESCFELMTRENYFHIEYSFNCDDEEQISYFPEKKCEICNEKIELHEDYEELFCLSDTIRKIVSDQNKLIFEESFSKQSGLLLDSIKKNLPDLMPFVGSGVSIPLGFPSWRGIIEKIAEGLSDNKKAIIKDHLDRNDYLDCFEIIFSDKENQLYKNIQEIKKHFSEEFNKKVDYSIDSNHKDIVNMKYPLIITTNYDLILENTKGAIKYETHVLSQIEDISSLKKERVVLHIHGVSSPSKKDTMVVDKNDYKKIYENEGIKRKLQSLLGDKVILFIGYSLDDHYFMEELMKVSQANNNYADYYAIMINSDLDILSTKLKYYDKIKIINLNVKVENILVKEDGFSKIVPRSDSEINNEIVDKIRFLIKYVNNELYFS